MHPLRHAALILALLYVPIVVAVTLATVTRYSSGTRAAPEAGLTTPCLSRMLRMPPWDRSVSSAISRS